VVNYLDTPLNKRETARITKLAEEAPPGVGRQVAGKRVGVMRTQEGGAILDKPEVKPVGDETPSAARDIAIVTSSRRGFDDYRDKRELVRQAASKGHEVDKRRLNWLRGQKKWALSSGVKWTEEDEKELKEAEATVKNPPKRRTSGVRDAVQPIDPEQAEALAK
jgi:hypothetical protein